MKTVLRLPISTWFFIGLSTVLAGLLFQKQHESGQTSSSVVATERPMAASQGVLPSLRAGEDRSGNIDETSEGSPETLSPSTDAADWKSIDAQVAASLETLEARYLPIFEALNLSPEDQQDLLAQLEDMEELRQVTLRTLREFEESRHDFDLQMTSLLSEEDFARYQELEKRQGAEAVVENLRALDSEDANGSLDQATFDRLADQLAAVEGGKNLGNSLGPYGGAPRVAVGARRIEEELSKEISSLEGERNYLRDLNPDPSVRQVLDRYYQTRVREAEALIEQARKAEEELRQGARSR